MPTLSIAHSTARVALARFFHLVATRDPQLLVEFVPAEDVIFIGSDEGEIATGTEEIRSFITRLYARPLSYTWETHRINATQSGNITWFFAEGEMTVTGAEGRKALPYRISGVLERINDRWHWRHYHGSEPVAAD